MGHAVPARSHGDRHGRPYRRVLCRHDVYEPACLEETGLAPLDLGLRYATLVQDKSLTLRATMTEVTDNHDWFANPNSALILGAPRGVAVGIGGFVSCKAVTASAANRPSAAPPSMIGRCPGSLRCARNDDGERRPDASGARPLQSSAFPIRPARSWMNWKAVRPEREPRVVAHSRASARRRSGGRSRP